jgi:hypothetical protein
MGAGSLSLWHCIAHIGPFYPKFWVNKFFSSVFKLFFKSWTCGRHLGILFNILAYVMQCIRVHQYLWIKLYIFTWQTIACVVLIWWRIFLPPSSKVMWEERGTCPAAGDIVVLAKDIQLGLRCSLVTKLLLVRTKVHQEELFTCCRVAGNRRSSGS